MRSFTRFFFKKNRLTALYLVFLCCSTMALSAQMVHSSVADTIGFAHDLTIIERKLGPLEKSIKDSLVLVEVQYFSFGTDGKVDKSQLYSGVLMVHHSTADDLKAIFKDLERDTFPIAKVIPINKYGLDRDSTGWDDLASMADNNTSVFNYRRSTSSNRLSKHGLGLAIDINPLFNPYEAYESDGKFVEPEGAFYDKNRAGAIHEKTIVSYFEKRGWTWGGRWGNPVDFQHFQKTGRRSEKHLLTKHNSIKDYFRIDESSGDILMYANREAKKNNKPEFVIYKSEIATFDLLLANLDEQSLLDIYEKKGSQQLSKLGQWGTDIVLKDHTCQVISQNNPAKFKPRALPTSLKGLRIALDPGHYAGDEAEAMMERRFILNEQKEVITFEAMNAYAVCTLLAEKLRAQGAEVFISHAFGKSSTGDDITSFLKKNGIKKKHFSSYEQLKTFQKSADYAKYKLLEKEFSKADLKERAKQINAFRPDLSIVMHFNVSNAVSQNVENELAPDNYSMMFVPGAFMEQELDSLEARFHFMRFLMTEDLQQSIRFSSLVLDNLEKTTGVPRVPKDYHVDYPNANYLENSCIKTDTDGVYARNLALSRTILGPMAFVETFFQNNIEEREKLAKTELEIEFGGKKRKVTQRNRDISEGLYRAIEEMLVPLEED